MNARRRIMGTVTSDKMDKTLSLKFGDLTVIRWLAKLSMM
jgi:ribosomal protein S17